jgi:membrane-bound ClpP family serine protease
MFYSMFGLGFIAGLLIVLGVVLLLVNTGIISAAVWAYWPVLLIIVGVYILTLRKRRKKIAVHQIFQRLATDDRVQDKIKKIIETVDEVVEKKIDEWHDEATEREASTRKNEGPSGKQKI